MSEAPLIYLVAGEPSGDAIGARLMAALSGMTNGRVRFAGVGGAQMRQQGLTSLFPMEELSVMGIAETLPHLRNLLRRIRQTAAAANAAGPQALVTIDSPDFSRRVARRLTDRSIPRIHYVAPSVWAWRPWRAKGFARDFTHLLALLPFEPPWFDRVGLACRFVGHPVVESGADHGDGEAFRDRHGIARDATVVCVLPGSRRGEVARLIDDFGGAVKLLARRRPGLRVVLPTVDSVAPQIETAVDDWPGQPLVVRGAADRHGAMAAADAALAASGTVALELALARVPTVIAYRMAPLTHFLVRRLVSVEFANLVNILEGQEIIPELIQGDCRPERLAAALEDMLGPAGGQQIEAVRPALEQLGVGGVPPSHRAAQAVLDIIGARGTSTAGTSRPTFANEEDAPS